MPIVRTFAQEAIDAVPAYATILTGRAAAFVHIHTTILAGETRLARAMIVVGPRSASASIRAWFRQAVVYLVLAEPADVARYTLAAEAVHLVLAGAAVQARIALTVIHVDLAALAGEAGEARASVTVDMIRAGAVVRAGIRRALVDLRFAVGAGIAGRTTAQVTAQRVVLAGGTVSAGRVPTGSRCHLAVSTAPTGWTGTAVATTMLLSRGRLGAVAVHVAHGRRLRHRASTTVQTRFRVTVEERRLTLCAGEA